MMDGGEVSDSIPIDLIIEILGRLPAKSIGRSRCVSKLWRSILHGPYITELFLTRSRARPRLFFALVRTGAWSFYSSPQNYQDPYQNKSSFHMKFSLVTWNLWGLTSGLLYFLHAGTLKREDTHTEPVICNPNTRQYAILPKLKRYRKSYSFLVFDPVDKHFKVLFMNNEDDDHKILTLGTGSLMWRKIQCPPHKPHQRDYQKGLCIDGVLYYLASTIYKKSYKAWVVCFDIRSETFKFIDKPGYFERLVNYKGALGGISWPCFVTSGVQKSQVSMWVLKDVDKHEWTEYVYTLCGETKKVLDREYFSLAGITATGEIVFAKKETYKSSFLCLLPQSRKEHSPAC